MHDAAFTYPFDAFAGVVAAIPLGHLGGGPRFWAMVNASDRALDRRTFTVVGSGLDRGAIPSPPGYHARVVEQRGLFVWRVESDEGGGTWETPEPSTLAKASAL